MLTYCSLLYAALLYYSAVPYYTNGTDEKKKKNTDSLEYNPKKVYWSWKTAQ